MDWKEFGTVALLIAFSTTLAMILSIILNTEFYNMVASVALGMACSLTITKKNKNNI